MLNFERCLEPVGGETCSERRTTCRAWEVDGRDSGLGDDKSGSWKRALRPLPRAQLKQLEVGKTTPEGVGDRDHTAFQQQDLGLESSEL